MGGVGGYSGVGTPTSGDPNTVLDELPAVLRSEEIRAGTGDEFVVAELVGVKPIASAEASAAP